MGARILGIAALCCATSGCLATSNSRRDVVQNPEVFNRMIQARMTRKEVRLLFDRLPDTTSSHHVDKWTLTQSNRHLLFFLVDAGTRPTEAEFRFHDDVLIGVTVRDHKTVTVFGKTK